MKFPTIMYPVYENKNPEGGFDYGFLTGERKEKDGLFIGGGVVERHFKKKQSFSFCVGVKSYVEVDEPEKAKRGAFKRFGERKPKTIEVKGDEATAVDMDGEEDDDNE